MAGESRSGRGRTPWVLALALGAVGLMPVSAADPCDAFSWNVALARPAPTLAVDKLYDIALKPQDQVRLVLAPAKKALADGAFAGMVTVHIPAAGKFVPTDDFTGSHVCRAPRKIVQFILAAGELTLQFASANSSSVQVTVTAAPK